MSEVDDLVRAASVEYWRAELEAVLDGKRGSLADPKVEAMRREAAAKLEKLDPAPEKPGRVRWSDIEEELTRDDLVVKDPGDQIYS